MFESAEVGNTIDKESYKREEPVVRAALLQAQRELAAAHFSVVVMVGGVQAAGKSEVVNLLLEWLDARGIRTHALAEPTDEEQQRPPLWRYWRRLPPAGRMGIFFGEWETALIFETVAGKVERAEADRRLNRFVEFERMLTSENTLLVKIWLHISKKVQKKRLRALEADPDQSWRVSKRDWRQHKYYDALRAESESVLRRTDTGEAPWHIIEGTDHRYRGLTVARTLLGALRARLDEARAKPPRPEPKPVMLTPPPVNVINQLDMTRALDEAEYDRQLPPLQARLNYLTRRLRKQQRSLVLVFEGPDAAGKGGTIRRLTQALDARDYQVISVSAPTDEERAHPYLWRFWRHLPGQGRVTIYDRSWYGRVLVERVEGFALPDEWQRAYLEINEFEEQLTTFGIIVLKFWLALTPEEQLTRFQDRERTPYKQYKLTPEDWRNRDRWDSYEAAACAMIEKTSTESAPWILVEANNKEWARIKVLSMVVERLAAELEA